MSCYTKYEQFIEFKLKLNKNTDLYKKLYNKVINVGEYSK